MSSYSLGHVQDHVLLRDLASLVVRDRQTTAELLAHLGEVDARGLHRLKAYACMRDYCVGELRMSEDMAFKRIRAARAARRFPPLFQAVADGDVSLSVVVALAPFIDRCDPAELLAEAKHRPRAEVEAMLAARFPQDDVPTVLMALPAAAAAHSPVTNPGPPSANEVRASLAGSLAPGPVGSSVLPARHETMGPHGVSAASALVAADGTLAPPTTVRSVTVATRVAPLSATRFALQVTIADTTRDKLRRAQELLGHAVPSGDVAQVLDRALDALIGQLEKRKYAASDRPRRARAVRDARTIPAHVRRAVRARDGDRCTFTSADGRRCESRTRLEFHHVISVARGGTATVEKTSLRCRAHNQLEAERELGAGFMEGKRARAKARREQARAAKPASRAPVATVRASSSDPSDTLAPAPTPRAVRAGSDAPPATLGAPPSRSTHANDATVARELTRIHALIDRPPAALTRSPGPHP